MSTNLNDTTPAAVTGGLNVKWQVDGSGNTSAYVPGFAGIAGVNAQVGVTYTIVSADSGKLLTLNNTSAVAVTLPIASSLPGNFIVFVENLGGGLVTITPTTSTIDAQTTLTLRQNCGVAIFTDGTNYFVMRGKTQEHASADATAQAANIAATTLYAVPAASVGLYKVSGYIIVSQAATTSCTLPSIVITWTDTDNNTAQSLTLTPTNSTNALTNFQQAIATINAKPSTNVQYSTTGYLSSGATPMQYAIHVRIEALP